MLYENGLERLCLEGKFEGRRARGRQRLTYLVSLAEKVGLKTHQLIHCAGAEEHWPPKHLARHSKKKI